MRASSQGSTTDVLMRAAPPTYSCPNATHPLSPVEHAVTYTPGVAAGQAARNQSRSCSSQRNVAGRRCGHRHPRTPDPALEMDRRMRTIGNILWLLLAGVWLAIGYVIAGILNC